MTDESSTITAVITGMTAAATMFIGFVGKRFITKVDVTAERLTAHEKESAIKFATNEQLQRVHDRIDESGKAAENNFKELRDNIGEVKNLLISGLGLHR